MKASFTMIAMLAFGLSTQPFAQQKIEHLMGQHPAVLVKRMEAQKPYDYQAQFYPHPAWLYMRAEPSEAMLALNEKAAAPTSPDRTRPQSISATRR